MLNTKSGFVVSSSAVDAVAGNDPVGIDTVTNRLTLLEYVHQKRIGKLGREVA